MLLNGVLRLIPVTLLVFEGSGANPPAAGAIGCLLLILGWAIISVLAFSVLMIRKRFRPSAKGRPDPLNLRASGKTPVAGSSSSPGGTN